MVIPRRCFLYLRHGETDFNAGGRAQGRSDIPLNERGRDQARQATRLLAGTGVNTIVASPLSRASETAAIVAGKLGLPVELDDDLREVAFGEREGEAMGAWYQDWIDGLRTPPGGESFEDLVRRGSAAISRHLAAGNGLVLFVAHGALFRAIRRALGQTVHVPLANGAPLSCRPDETGWCIEMLQPGN